MSTFRFGRGPAAGNVAQVEAANHKLRIQLDGFGFPTASFEVACDIGKTPLKVVMEKVAKNVMAQAAANGCVLDGGLYCNITPFEFAKVCNLFFFTLYWDPNTVHGHSKQSDGGLYRSVHQLPKIENLDATPSMLGLGNGGTLHVASSQDVDELLINSRCK